MNKRRLIDLAYFACLLFFFLSCSSDRNDAGEGSGTLHVQVSANPEVIVGTNTRASGETETELPDVNDFSFSIFKGENLRGEWATLTDFMADDELTLRSGSNYSAKACYGEIDKEGFELPYYEGNQPFAITKGKTTNVNVTCYIANAKLSIVYTDEFKDYFSTYSSEVTSSLGNTVKYPSSEERYAYFKPGDLHVAVKVRKKEGYSQEVTLNAKDFTAEARHAYILTLDVDAGASTLNISFSDDIPNQEPVTIEISDEALSAPAPYFTANGFEANQPLEVVEGKSAESPEVYAYLNAAAGIVQCNLTTQSASLIEQGWPESVDLANVSAETLAIMQKLGLRIVGLGDKKDKIAKIDFTEVISFLEYNNGNAEHTFELKATDRLSKENAEPLIFKVNSKDNLFAVNAGEPVLYGTTKMKANLTLDGDPAKVSYWLKKENGEEQVIPSSIQSHGTSHDLVFKFSESQYSDIEVEAKYLRRSGVLNSTMGEPEVLLSLEHPGDVWTKQASLHLKGTVDGWNFQSSKVDENGKNGAWNVEECNLTGSNISLTGLTPGKRYVYRFIKKDEEEDVICTSNLQSIQTEEELQIPNSDFEKYTKNKRYSASGTGGQDIFVFYPYAVNDESKEQWWDTRNMLTTSERGSLLGACSWYYSCFPGTVPTNELKLTASWHLKTYDAQNLVTEGYDKSNAIEIATVGWGKGNKWSGFGKGTDNKTAGSLFIGSFENNIEQHGKAFSSRPTKIRFWYKYYSYNNEYTKPYISIEDKDGIKIGKMEEELIINNTVNEFTEGIINISYLGHETQKAAKIKLEFLSTSSQDPATKAVHGDLGDLKGNGDSRHIGSILTIDDIHLEYEK